MVGPGTVAASTTAAATGGGIDTSDIATLNDALGSAGVDLRVRIFLKFHCLVLQLNYTLQAEEESLHNPSISSLRSPRSTSGLAFAVSLRVLVRPLVHSP